MGYEIVGYSPAFKTQITELRSRAFGGTVEQNARYLEWKYEQNPYLDEPLFYLALHAGRIVGMRAMYGSCWQAGGGAEPAIIPAGADFAVDRAHRGRDVARRLLAFAADDLGRRGYAYAVSMSANRATRLLQLRAGWKRAAAYRWFQRGGFPGAEPRRQRLTVPVRPSLVARARRKTARLVGRPRPETPFHGFDERIAAVRPALVARAIPRIADMAKLVSQQREAVRMQHVRDETYYRWRYSDPASSYRFVSCDGSGGGSKAFFVLQQRRSSSAVTIVDWETSSPTLWTELLRAIVDATPEPLQIASTTFSDVQTDSLRRFGFGRVFEVDTRAHPAPGVFVRPLAGRADDETPNRNRLLDTAYWDVRLICSDAF